MAITLVLHEATRTGAPRVGGLIARELALSEDVHVVVLKDGPLVPWLVGLLGPERLTVVQTDEFSHRVPFDQRLRAATKLLATLSGDLVYVNSLAASTFVLAAKSLGLRSIIHVHEKAVEINSLLRAGLTKIEIMALADGVVLAAEDLSKDILEVYGLIPANSANFGIAIDIEAVRAAAAVAAPPARNASGQPLNLGKRMVVGMCGHASRRKGSDIFFETAKALPNCDFLWVGAWSKEEAPENTVYDEFLQTKLPNLYAAGAVDNPYAYISQMDMFFLSSREDPNPLVLAEAMVLRVPLLCFSKTTAVVDRIGRSGILCHGLPNVEDAVRVLEACAPGKIRSDGFRQLSDAWISAFDLKEKMRVVMELIEKIRAADTAPATALLEEAIA